VRIAENTLKILCSSFTDVQVGPINYMQATDKELLMSCRQGNESAWSALVDRYQRLIYAVPRRAGLNEDQAGEVFQEVFVTLFEKMNEINQPDRLHAWLVTTARRKTWRLLSKQRSFHSTHTDDTGADDEVLLVVDDSPLPDETLMRLEEQHRIRTALGGLDARCQKLLTMLYYEVDPPAYSEIAALLGTPEGSIGPTRARCLKKMLKLLGE
jgi:RNA polymerase sigma factor (sigma-70 family)